MVSWCPSTCHNSSFHFELDLRVYRFQKYYEGVEPLGKGSTVANVLSRENTTLPSVKLVAMQRLCCSACLAPALGCEHESCSHQGMHHHLTYSDLLTSLHPALLKWAGGQQRGVSRSPKQTTHAAAPELRPPSCEAPLARKTCY